MAVVQKLANPPIVEALMDFRVGPSRDLDVSELRAAGARLPGYPKVEERRFLQGAIRVHGGTSEATATHGTYGYGFRSADGNRLVQFRIDGFTFNAIDLYPGWEVLRKEALEAWHVYVESTRPKCVTRAALRYINRLEFQVGTDIAAFGKYLTMPPDLHDGLREDNLTGYLCKRTLSDPTTGVQTNLIHALEATDRDVYPVLLDIDVYRVGEFAVDGKELSVVLRDLHEKKNKVFFSSLTEDAVALFL